MFPFSLHFLFVCYTMNANINNKKVKWIR